MLDKDKFFSNFYDINNIANFKMLECIKLLFDKKNIFNNAANYMLIILLLFRISTAVVFCFHNNLKIKKDINKIYNETNIKEIKDETKKQRQKLTKNEDGKEKKKHKQPKKKLKKKKRRKSYFKKKAKNIIETTNIVNNNEESNNAFKKENNFLDNNPKTKDIKKKSITNINNIEDENSINALKMKGQNFQNIELKQKEEKATIYIDKELNSMEYEQALIYDKRNYFQYYLSLIKNQNLLIYTFFQYKDYNSQMIKIELFLFSFTINFIISAMFYSDDTMHKIFIDEGKFDFIYQIPQMLYSAIISFFLEFILGNFGLYEDDILDVRKRKKDKENLDIIIQDVSKAIKIKIVIFFIITYILTFAFWIYLGCFCAVYKNTQIHLLKEVLSSFFISFISPFFIYLIPGIFRIVSLKKGTNDKPCLYKMSKFLQKF